MSPRKQEFESREVPQTPLSGGMNDHVDETLLPPYQSPLVQNVEFDRSNVSTTGGAIKLNNQVAPGSAVQSRVDPGLAPLPLLATPLAGAGNGALGICEVPARGSAFFPYVASSDIGGQFVSEGNLLLGTEVFHVRRGRSFEFNISFRVPPEEKLYATPTNGSAAPATPVLPIIPPHGFDEALDECFCIIQKGGDSLTPMSWALAVVNIGAGVGLSGQLPATRVSNYALVFMWYDAPQWGETAVSVMKYNLSSGQDVLAGGGSQFCTQAMRAVLIHKYVEPNVDYSVSIQMQMDSGSPGATTPTPANTAWNADGFFKAQVWSNRDTYSSHTYIDSTATSTGLEVYRGPTDSLSYLCRYGIRYAGKDARHAGLGQRFTPWMRCGFIPWGMDSAPLRSGGFSMVDRSSTAVATLYGAATYGLTAQHTSGDAFVVVNLQGLRDTNIGTDPKGGALPFPFWFGLNFPNCNVNALRGYRLVSSNDWGANRSGAIFTLLDYTEVGASFRFNIFDGANAAAFGTFTNAGQFVYITCFRWHQREVVFGHFRTWAAPRDYDSADTLLGGRRKIGLRSSVVLSDRTEPDIANLQECYPCDDAGGGVLREIVVGGPRHGFILPLANAVSESGPDGEKSLFLSGSGEALTLDLSEDPTFQRELKNMLSGSSQGFGFEISFTPLEAIYALPEAKSLPDDPTGALQGFRPRCSPDLVVWDVKDATTLGTRAVPRPLLVLGHRGLMTATDPVPFRRPFAYTVEVGHRSDQESVDPVAPQALQPWWRDTIADSHFRYEPTAPWVGRRVTLQVGIQSDGVADEYDVYIALHPKDAFLPANGDPADAEHQWWTDSEANTAAGAGYNINYFKGPHLKIKRKDLVRSVLTVGGRWNCRALPGDTANLGVTELSARMLVHEVRWFGTSPSGALAPYSGGVALSRLRNGKLEGAEALPQGPLEASDMERELGPGVDSVSLTNASQSVLPAGATTFYPAEARNSLRSIKGHYLLVSGDDYRYGKDETQKVQKRDYYAIGDVAANGSSLTLTTPYQRPTRRGAIASVFALLGYTRFEDDVRDRPLLLARGSGYDILNTTVAQVVLTDGLWANKAPTQGSWKLRIYSPFGGRSAGELLPIWTRGLVTERRIVDDGILGLHGFNERIYAGVRGALYEADDRWRFDGPTPEIPTSLMLRSKMLSPDVTVGLHNDRIVWNDANTFAGYSPSVTDTYCTVWDAWIDLTKIDEFQTILWIGVPESNPALNASNSGHIFQQSLRLNRGRPELCFGSTAFYTGTTVPEKGIFTATARQTLEAGRWNHVRFYVFSRANGTIVLKPYCKVNGKHSDVGVNAVDNTLSGTLDWLAASSLISYGSTGRVIVGCGRDSYVAPDSNAAFSATAFQGTLTRPQRLQGWMHSLNGKCAQVAVTRQPSTGNAEPADFDPLTLSYDIPGVLMQFLFAPDGDGVGHRIRDPMGLNTGLICSHPFVSVFHEMGNSNQPYSFTEYGQQVYVTNGGKPVVVLPDGTAQFAGVPAPLVAPTFATERFPLWKKNLRAASGTNDQNDPVAPAVAGAAQQTYHYNSVGNAFWRQALSTTESLAMSWDKEDYFFLKFYFRPRRTDGRIQLWRKGPGAKSGGPFLEMVDGKVRFGWYDTDLKDDVYVESTNQVFEPNRLHYVYVRKRWPTNDAVEGNWESSWWSNGKLRRATFTSGITGTFQIGETVNFTAGGGTAGSGVVTKVYGATASTMEFILAAAGAGNPGATSVYTGATSGATGTTSVAAPHPTKDMLVVGQFRYAAESALFDENWLQIDATTEPRAAISLTADSYGMPGGTNGTGLVIPPGLTFTGGITGFVVCANPANHVAFYRSMVGMYWIWGTGAPAAIIGRRYRVVGLTDGAGLAVTTVSAVGIQVAAVEAGDSIDFSGAIGRVGGVFRGIALKKSAGFDSSKSPDKSQAIVQFMGTTDQGGALSGFSIFDGETWTPGWGVIAPATAGVDPTMFETASATDRILTGTDGFRAENYDSSVVANLPNALQFQAGAQVGQWDGRVYAGAAPATSQPNTELAIRRTNPALTATSSEGEPFWAYNQDPSVWAQQRYIAVAFYDPAQNVVGNPSPLLLLQPTADDATNPSGSVQTTVSNLPVGRDGVELWIYISAAGGSAGALFRVARVANGTSTFPLRFSEVDTISGPALEFTNSEPPRCSIVRAISAYMVYGALEAELTGILPSRPGQPSQVDFSKLFRFPGGSGDAITALYELDGLGVAMKRRALGSFSFDANGNAIVGQVSGGVGAVSNQTVCAKDNLLYFFSDAGFQVTYRQGVTNLGRPQFVGQNLQTFAQDDVDRMRLNRASGAVSRGREMFVVIVKRADDPRALTRISVNLKDEASNLTVCSSYRNPALSCIASVQDKAGGIERLVGGTEDGFVVWLDDRRSRMVMFGEDQRIWGATEIPVQGTPSLTAFETSASDQIDTTLEGPRGVVMRYLDGDGEEREVELLAAESNHIHFSEIADSAPVVEKTGAMASLDPIWESAWIDMGNPRVSKVLLDTTLVFRTEPSGELQVDLYGDFDAETPIETVTVNLSERSHVVVWTGAAARRFKLRVKAPHMRSLVEFALASIVWRVRDETQEGSG